MTGVLCETIGVEMVKHFNVAHTNIYLSCSMLIRSVMRFRNAYHKPRQNMFWIQLLYIYFCFCYIHFEINGDPSNLISFHCESHHFLH